MADVSNPYSAPTAEVADMDADSDAEIVRQAHIATEASVQAFGLLYILGAVGAGFGGVMAMTAGDTSLMVTILLALAGLMGGLGYGLRALKSWVRIPAILLAVLGMLGFPFGTLINGYFLYLLLCEKGRYLFTPEYAQIRKSTPQVRYRSSMLVRILFVLLMTALGAALLFALFD